MKQGMIKIVEDGDKLRTAKMKNSAKIFRDVFQYLFTNLPARTENPNFCARVLTDPHPT